MCCFSWKCAIRQQGPLDIQVRLFNWRSVPHVEDEAKLIEQARRSRLGQVVCEPPTIVPLFSIITSSTAKETGSRESILGVHMRKISSGMTWWHKKGSPALCFGFIGLFTLIWIPGVILQRVPPPTLLIPIGIAVLAHVLTRWLVFPLVDEVFIEDYEIIVRHRGEEDRFPISNIINVGNPLFVNPERIVLTLKQPCRFGREVVFSPPFRLWHLSRHPIAEELMRRARGMDEKELDAVS